MEKVIFKKNGKIISIPWSICKNFKIGWLYKKRGRFIVFDDEISEIVFKDCKIIFDLNFELEKKQKIIFEDCVIMSDLEFICGNVDIRNSIFDGSSLIVKSGDSVTIDFNKPNAELKKLCIRANSVSITNDFSTSGNVSIFSKNINVNGVNCTADSISFDAINLSIMNSRFKYYDHFYNGYKNLVMSDVLFYSDYGKLSFSEVIDDSSIGYYSGHKDVATYYSPVDLTDSDILEGKEQSIYSLISILKGYKNEMNRINESDIAEKTSNINDYYSLSLAELEQRKQALQKEKSDTIEYVKENLTNRKIKTLQYPKR